MAHDCAAAVMEEDEVLAWIKECETRFSQSDLFNIPRSCTSANGRVAHKKILLWLADGVGADGSRRKDAMAAIKEHLLQFPPGGSSAASVFAMSEPSANKKANVAALGRALGSLKAKIAPESRACVKPEWATGKIFWKPSGDRSQEMFSWMSMGWKGNEALLKTATAGKMDLASFCMSVQ